MVKFFKYFYMGSKDVVQQFCEKHLDKIKAYIKNLTCALAMPAEETILNRSYQFFNTIERNRQSMILISVELFHFDKLKCL